MGGRVAYGCLKRGYIMGGRGRFWEGRLYLFKRGYIFDRGRFWEGRI